MQNKSNSQDGVAATAIVEANNFYRMCTLVNESLDEAEDNMKFLDGIKKQVEICVVAKDFSLIRTAIKKVMKSLRHAWMLSKYYNTDEKEFPQVLINQHQFSD